MVALNGLGMVEYEVDEKNLYFTGRSLARTGHFLWLPLHSWYKATQTRL
jgi:hypothetical protein